MEEHQDERSLKLVEMIYRTALDPQDYDGFMASWNDWIDARMTGLDKLRMSDPAMSSPEIAAHFELALRLLERIGEPPESTPSAGPRMLVHPSGQILWQNAAADRSFGSLRQSNVLENQMSNAHRGALELFLTALENEESPDPVVIQILPTDSTRAIAFRLEAMRRVPTETVALLSALASPWLLATDRLLSDTHGLSESECAICALLADGLAPAAIAQQRGTSVGTVRTQIKSIQSKTQTSSQTELASHLHVMQRMAETLPSPEPARALAPPIGGRLVEEHVNGRVLPVEEHGPPDGRPVIFLHGMLDGTGTTVRIWQALERLNLRLICPHRPAFGNSLPPPPSGDAGAQSLASDMAELLKRQGISDPVILGHLGGAVYSPYVAKSCGARAVVNVSGGVPIVSKRQFDIMSRRQRLVAYTARYALSVLPFVINAGIRQIRNGGGETFLDSLYENAPVDNEVIRDHEVRRVFLNGVDFSIAQGNKGFALDSEMVTRDWTEVFIQSAPVPVHLIHGAHDPVVSIGSVRDFAHRHSDRVTLTVVEEAGQLLFYQKPDVVLKTIAALFD